MGRWGLSSHALAVDMVEMLLSLLLEGIVGHVLDSLLALLCVRELGVDAEMDILASVSGLLSFCC